MAAGKPDVAVAEVAATEQDPALLVERIGTHGGSFYCRSGHPLLARPCFTFDDVTAFPLAMTPLPGRIARVFERAEAADGWNRRRASSCPPSPSTWSR